MDELAKRFADLAEKYGPNVADAAMRAAQIEAYSALVAAALCLAVGAGLIRTGQLLWRKVKSDGWDEITIMPASIAILFGGIVGVIGICIVIDPWTWVAINHPELWLAKKAFRI